MQVQLSTQMTIVYCLALVCGTVLAAMGKLDPETVAAGLAMWLAPAPISIQKGAE